MGVGNGGSPDAAGHPDGAGAAALGPVEAERGAPEAVSGGRASGEVARRACEAFVRAGPCITC
eukprot:3825597-Alexandrium_andersonii.AAC.1